MTKVQSQLLVYRNEIKSYLPNATRKQTNYIIAEHTSWPEFSPELGGRQIARYMSTIGIKRQTRTHKSQSNRLQKKGK